jgi:tetratricopeptide (TPR) repeat protein
MPLTAGDKLGPYEILGLIGAGGMGEVYRAHDSRLGRDVAIKVSAQQFSDRFEREARAIAALNHSSICQVYDIGPNYLVMEFIEGTPLVGPLPLDVALLHAVQIADALSARARQGDHASRSEAGHILELDENYHLGHFYLSLALVQQGKIEEALASAEKAYSLAPWARGSTGFVAGLLKLSGDTGRAEAVLENLGEGTARSSARFHSLPSYLLANRTGCRLGRKGNRATRVLDHLFSSASARVTFASKLALARVGENDESPTERFVIGLGTGPGPGHWNRYR